MDGFGSRPSAGPAAREALSVKPFGFKTEAGRHAVLVPNEYVSRENELETRFRNPPWRPD